MKHIALFNTIASSKRSARSLKKFLQKQQIDLPLSRALDAVAVMSGKCSWAAMQASLTEGAIYSQLTPASKAHLKQASGTLYEGESVIVIHNGFQIRYVPENLGTSYVRVCDPFGREIGYWIQDELAEDPSLVLGAILGCLVQGQHLSAPRVQDGCIEPLILDVSPQTVSSALIEHVYWQVDDASTEFDDYIAAFKSQSITLAQLLEFEDPILTLKLNRANPRYLSIYADEWVNLKWNPQDRTFDNSKGLQYSFSKEISLI